MTIDILTQERFFNKVLKLPSGCWIWMACLRKTGYGAFGINGNVEYTHRVSYKIHNGDIPDGLFVCHHCDVRQCVNPSHLFIGTQKDNMRDAFNKGRMVMPLAKLTESQVREIRLSSKPQKYLAKHYSVNPSSISKIKTGKTYGWLI